MTVNKNRPVNLDLRTIKQPVAAISSILHRVTGVVLFVGVLFLLYVFALSLQSEQGFAQTQALFRDSVLAKLITWGLLSALVYHMAAGVKHLIMDAGFCEGLDSGRIASQCAIAAGVIGVVLTGVWVW